MSYLLSPIFSIIMKKGGIMKKTLKVLFVLGVCMFLLSKAVSEESYAGYCDIYPEAQYCLNGN